jgi:toluene monooxygenase electron transfer component
MRTITITIAAKDTAFDCAEDDTILRAALRSGLGFPYECNVGSCGNCRFELIEGAVEHLRADAPAWGERELARKRYLGCQARPLADCTIKVRLADQYKSIHPPVRGEAVLIETTDINHDIREFRLKRAEPVAFLPGQYALLHLDGIEGWRAYSMANTGDDPTEWHFQIRRVPNGHVTSHLFDRLKIGDTVGIDGPYGMAYLREGRAARPDLSRRWFGAVSDGRDRQGCGRQRPAFRAHGALRLWRPHGPRHLRRRHPEGAARLWRTHPFPPGGLDDRGGRRCGRMERADGASSMTWPATFSASGWRSTKSISQAPPAMSEALQRMLIEMKVPQEQIHFDQFY